MEKGQVKVDTRFWQIARNEYVNWKHALGREILQNSLDAESTCIRITVTSTADGCDITVTDNGCGMSLTTVKDKLLCLGASGKEFKESVGGFGIAKTLILFSQLSYSVTTTYDGITTYIKGKGSDFTIRSMRTKKPNGTTFRISTDAEEYDIRRGIETFCVNSKFQAKVYLNGQLLDTDTRTYEEELCVDNVTLIVSPSEYSTARTNIAIGTIDSYQSMGDVYLGKQLNCAAILLVTPMCLTNNRDSLTPKVQKVLDSMRTEVSRKGLTNWELETATYFIADEIMILSKVSMPPKITKDDKELLGRAEYLQRFFNRKYELGICFLPQAEGAYHNKVIYISPYDPSTLLQKPKRRKHSDTDLIALMAHEAAHEIEAYHNERWGSIFTDILIDALTKYYEESDYFLGPYIKKRSSRVHEEGI